MHSFSALGWETKGILAILTATSLCRSNVQYHKISDLFKRDKQTTQNTEYNK